MVAAIAVTVTAISFWRATHMPLHSYRGPLPTLTADQAALRDRLADHVRYLSSKIGERNVSHPSSLLAAKGYLRTTLQDIGYEVTELRYFVGKVEVTNLEVVVPGADSSKTVLVGAHYDSAQNTPGANDNASGVAAVIELARNFHNTRPRQTLRFVFFVNEEPPFFQTDRMGSLVYARKLRENKVSVSAMLSLETIGYYSDTTGSQHYPFPLGLIYPSRGNFIGFVSNPESRELLLRAIRTFRATSTFPSEGLAAPSEWPGIGWSDHWSFWQENYPAIMITDTAVFRYSYYHSPHDVASNIDLQKTARVVDGISNVIKSLAEQD
jgi:hypothetical protein